MAAGIPAGLTREEGRRFGLTVGAAFLVLSGLLWWRGRHSASLVFLVVAGALLLAGLMVPARLGPIHRAWMGLAHLLSRVTTPVFMGIVYFLVLTPTGWLMRLFGRNPIRHRLLEGGFWVRKSTEEERRGTMEHQF